MRFTTLVLMALLGMFLTSHVASAAENPGQEWLRYVKSDTPPDFATISRFMAAHPDFPRMSKMRTLAERAMPSSIPDQQALRWFSANPPQTLFGMTVYAGSLQRSGQQAKAEAEINTWWETANLTKDDQAKARATFGRSIKDSANVKRLSRLIYKEQYTNARALAYAMGGNYITLTEARIGLRTGKADVPNLIRAVPLNLQSDEGFLFDRLHWRRETDNDEGAIEILNRTPSSEQMYDPDDWGKERGIIVRRLFEERKYAQAYKIAAGHKIKSGAGFATNEWMAGWLALEYLNKPWESFEHFERLYHNVETPISKSRAAFWAGLASEALKHPEIAQQWYSVGARYQTTFYGQLSAQKLGIRARIINNNDVRASNAIKNSDMAVAARWLRQNGYKSEAGSFLSAMIEKAKKPEDFASVSELASSLSMKNLAIKAAQESERVTGVTMVGYAFPKIEKYMSNVDVEWALVHALVRQESRYDTEAQSSAGARGLMQLMPSTAKEVAKKAGLSHETDWLLTKPQHNVALGTRYLQQLLNKYNGNYAMALAAYNAGPGRVDRWIGEIGDPRSPNVDLVNWIEMIPIYETRNYVQRVLEGVEVYRQTLQSNKNLASAQ